MTVISIAVVDRVEFHFNYKAAGMTHDQALALAAEVGKFASKKLGAPRISNEGFLVWGILMFDLNRSKRDHQIALLHTKVRSEIERKLKVAA